MDFNFVDKYRNSALALLLFGFTSLAKAQVPFVPDPVLDPDQEGYIYRGEFFDLLKNYEAVTDQMGFILDGPERIDDNKEAEVLYLYGKSLYEEGDQRCVEILLESADLTLVSPKAEDARLMAGDFYFYKKNYAKALEIYEIIDYSRLDTWKGERYQYHKALSLINIARYKDAKILLERLQLSSEYSLAAKYYLAYIDYAEENFKAAYAGFVEVKKELGTSTMEGIYPDFYIAQMEYSRGNYISGATAGSELLKKDVLKDPVFVAELKRITGLSLFKEDNYNAAYEYLKDYVNHKDVDIDADARYALGVIYYDRGNFKNSSACFREVAEEDNELGQSASLYLGQIALEEDLNDEAALYFEKAATMNYNSDITEIALYNSIVARSDGAKVPFSSTAQDIEQFLKRFPDSDYSTDLNEFLAESYYNENDYMKALTMISKIKNPTKKVNDVKQKILYRAGIEALEDGDAKRARRYFSESILTGSDTRLKEETRFWLGDACYASGDYVNAISEYKAYIKTATAGRNKTLAIYDLACAEMATASYLAAEKDFELALSSTPSLEKTLYDDALIKLGDARYYTGKYTQARKQYEEAIKRGAAGSDYATYRHAIMLGLEGDNRGKIKELNEFNKKYPSSVWHPYVIYETAATYTGTGDYNSAIRNYEELTSLYPLHSKAREGELSLALLYMENGNKNKGVAVLKEIIKKYPSSTEAYMADSDLKRYYGSIGGLDEYIEFIKTVPGAPSPDAAELESIAFEEARKAATSDQSDLTLIEKYINTYPDGPNITEAYILKAETLEEGGLRNATEALQAYRKAAERATPEFAALAYAGIMRLSDSPDERLKYAALVKESPGLPSETIEEAKFIEASELLSTSTNKEAVAYLAEISQNPATLAGAKAAVMLGNYYLSNGEPVKALDIFRDFTDKGSQHQYWLARGFIGLADAYHATGKNALATQYLKSLKENYPGKEIDIKDMIETRLSKWQK